ncbi:caspase family protein [Flammeovirgaceae bacterium SG7u.111]|nr:caspase family protein [Flammeovirgaceae bacterium SG7u.132]WPO38057.1 caspase family protein [Flammeovirgaceae bacterium SG7u.111]
MKSYLIVTIFLLSFITATAQQRMINVVHTVKRGETIYSISKRYNTSRAELLKLNKLRFQKLRVGQRLIVKKVTYDQAKRFAKKHRFQITNNKSIIIDRNLSQEEEKLIADAPAEPVTITGQAISPETPAKPEIKKEDILPSPVAISSDIDSNIPKAESVNTDAIAVVIGNKDYTDEDVPSVDFALRDAESVKTYLVDALGFREGNIIYVENATQANFNSVFGNVSNHKGMLFNYVKEGKSDVFVFYSGHGGPDPETKEPYFIPVDCEPSLVSLNGYSMNTFYANLGKVPYRNLTVVIDACFSGASEKGMLLNNISPVFIKPKDKIFADERATIITAAAGDQVASWYPEQGHSLLTYFYLKGLQGAADANKNKEISLGEMKNYLNENVTYMARRLNSREQEPEIHGLDETVLIGY